MKKFFLINLLISLLLLIGCSSSSGTRPDWCNNVPEPDDGNMFFVGLSAVHATDKGSRDDAYDVAVKRVVQYMGVGAKAKWEKALVSYGSASKVIDPVEATRAFERQVSYGVARRLKTTKMHDDEVKNGYKTCTLTYIPESTLNELYQDWTNAQKKIAENQAAAAKDGEAKKQWKDAMNFWADMEKSGLPD
jgi:hypothetical protein